MTEVERKALEAAQICSDGETVMSTSGGFYYKAEDVIRRLSRAGLLATPLMLRALEHMRFYADPKSVVRMNWFDEAHALGREALAYPREKGRRRGRMDA